jgi:hypothetical protein
VRRLPHVVLSEKPDGVVRVRSKGLAVMAGGRAGTVVYDDVVQVVYDDVVQKTEAGWRVARRKVTARMKK